MSDITDALEIELEIVTTAITNILLTGAKYETGSGASKRIFEAADLAELRKYRVDIENKLKGSKGLSGMLLGF